MVRTAKEASASSSSPERLSLIMFPPMRDSRAKAIQWSKETMYCSKADPNKYPAEGISAWKPPNQAPVSR